MKQFFLQQSLGLPLIADGAMGTFFLEQTGGNLASCESANLEQPELIRHIHRAYVDAGAQLLRTNTFAAIDPSAAPDFTALTNVTRAGYRLAIDAAAGQALVAADIGPAFGLEPELAFKAYKIMIDTFCAEKAKLFILETFSDPEEAIAISQLIRKQQPDAQVIASFAVSADGQTRKGINLRELALVIDQCPTIDVFGLNCGVGPTHLHQLLEQLPHLEKPLSLMPNGGYPRRDQQRTLFGATPAYFAQATSELVSSDVCLIGGCCGTTPDHIRALARQLANPDSKAMAHLSEVPAIPAATRTFPPAGIHTRSAGFPQLVSKMQSGVFVTVCELDPPKDSNLEPLIQAARLLAGIGLDAITLADSPLARIKVDPVVAAARIQRETGMPAMPHLACRDRNVNALRSLVLGAHAEGIRQILAITGDGIPESDRGFIKPVFNVNSIGLLEQINQMNRDQFGDHPLLLGASLDLNVSQKDSEYNRLMKKKAAGASFILTQPLFAPVPAEPLLEPARRAGLKVLLGLMPLVSYRNARYMYAEVPGIRIPETLLDRFDPQMSREEASAVGLEICLEVARVMRPHVDGFYLIAPFNRADLIAQLYAGLRKEHLLGTGPEA
jgi:homocysteine S-methyltransferase